MKEELFPLLEKHMLEVVLPNHKQILCGPVDESEDTSEYVGMTAGWTITGLWLDQ